MGKRSDFSRRANDKYDTPESAVFPLLRHLHGSVRYAEPCAGKGKLIRTLNAEGHQCVFASDIAPHNSRSPMPIIKRDALKITAAQLDRAGADVIISNPPWARDILHPMVYHFMSLRPTILLWDSDWAHTTQASDLIKRCSKIVSIGRVKWIPGSKFTGVDNSCWYFFPMDHHSGPRFVGRS